MACGLLTKGRGLDCNRISGGVKYIYFSVYDQIDSFAYDSTNELEIDTIEKETAKAKIVLNVLNIISPIVVFTYQGIQTKKAQRVQFFNDLLTQL